MVFELFMDHSFISDSLSTHYRQVPPLTLHPPWAKDPGPSVWWLSTSESFVVGLGSNSFGGLRQKKIYLGAEGSLLC